MRISDWSSDVCSSDLLRLVTQSRLRIQADPRLCSARTHLRNQLPKPGADTGRAAIKHTLVDDLAQAQGVGVVAHATGIGHYRKHVPERRDVIDRELQTVDTDG